MWIAQSNRANWAQVRGRQTCAVMWASSPRADIMQKYVLISEIRVPEGHNPRENFNAADHERLVESIRDHGLITPIMVRPCYDGGGYLLVAGERRLRACKALGKEAIPALIRDVDETQAHRLALLENLDRKELSPAEEALVAQRHVDGYEGDHEAAAKSLGWGVQKLRHRLRLLHCAAEVMDALVYDKLTLGHAELLATLPADRQLKALPKILAEGITVAALKEQLQAFSVSLSDAAFDTAKAGCMGCQYNSTTQGQLFESNIGAGRCTNRECFGEKTREALDEKRTTLKEEFGTVAFLTEKLPDSTIPILINGQSGIGREAFAQCRGCAHFGAVIDDRLGASTGKVDRQLCFNRTCHTEKVQAYQRTLAPTPSQPPSIVTPVAAADAIPVKASKPDTGDAAVSAPRALPKAVEAQYAAVVRQAVKVQLATHEESVLGLAVYGMMRLAADETGRAGVRAIAKELSLGEVGSQHNGLVMGLMQRDKGDLERLLVKAMAALLDTNPDENSGMDVKLNRRELGGRVVREFGLDLSAFVKVDEGFLSAHTKAGITQLLDESGFSQWMRSRPDGEKAFKDLVASSKADLIKGILAANYQGFAGYVPNSLQKKVDEWARK